MHSVLTTSDSWVIRHSMLGKVPHGFFTRKEGVSSNFYASLNCGFSTGDDPYAVQENRHRVAEEMGVSEDYLWGAIQVHGNKVIHVTAENRHIFCEADAAVTSDPKIALSVLTADCAPVLLSSKKGDIVGVAHAGWRGAVLGVLETTIEAMEQQGAKIEDIIAVIGPCIGRNAYEVKEDMRSQVLEQDPGGEIFFTLAKKDHYYFDLAAYCLYRLKRRGIGQAIALNIDTFGDPSRFFSYRRSTLTDGNPVGRQISSITCCKG